MELTHQHGSNVRQARGRGNQRHDRDLPTVMRKRTLAGPSSGQRPVPPGRWSRRSNPPWQNVSEHQVTGLPPGRRRPPEGRLLQRPRAELGGNGEGPRHSGARGCRSRARHGCTGGRLPRHRAGLGDPADQVRCAAVRRLHALHEVGVLGQSLRGCPRRRQPTVAPSPARPSCRSTPAEPAFPENRERGADPNSGRPSHQRPAVGPSTG
jgi:hypothetical protein